jgi:hypothetical protein
MVLAISPLFNLSDADSFQATVGIRVMSVLKVAFNLRRYENKTSES